MILTRNIVLIFTIALLMVGSACDAIPVSLLSEPSPTPTTVRNVLATRRTAPPTPIPPTATLIAVPTMTLQARPTLAGTLSQPTAVPATPSTEGFCCLRFAAGPYVEGKESFPAGTEIVYAIWEYKGLEPGDQIRRIWIRDNLIWITREEKWDWDKYGAEGTVRDLSIFDYEGSGLQSAEYRLQLYVNDELHQESAFVILPP